MRVAPLPICSGTYGVQVLTFADGRQNAANFAWESTLFSRASTYRGLLLEYGARPQERDPHPTIEDAALTLAERPR